MATAIPKAYLASSAIRCRNVETGPNLGVLAVFPSTGATCRCPLPSTGSRGLNSPASAVSGRRRRRGAQAGGVRSLPPPDACRCQGAVRPYAVVRRTRRRGDAVRGAAAVWGRRRAGTACACCARYSTSWSPASSSSCS